MSAFRPRVMAAGLVTLMLAGCGDSATAPPVAAPPAPSAHAQAPAAAAPAATEAAAPAKPDSKEPITSELLIYLPPTLSAAAGVEVRLMQLFDNQAMRRFLSYFDPAINFLTRAGIPSDQVAALWVGCDRDGDEVLLCARVIDKFDPQVLRKALRAGTEAEEVGKARVYTLPEVGGHQNSIALLDDRVILAGRTAMVQAALITPKEGAVRFGLSSLNLPSTLCWVAGSDAAVRRHFKVALATSSVSQAIDRLQILKTRGMAAGLGLNMPQANAQASSPGNPSSGSPAAGSGGPLELSLGLSFDSDSKAQAAEQMLGEFLKVLQQLAVLANTANTGGTPASGTPPAGSGEPAGTGSVLRSAFDSRSQRTDLWSTLLLSAADAFGPVARENERVRLSTKNTSSALTLGEGVFELIPEALGVTPVADGVYEGTLSRSHAAFGRWESTKPTSLRGATLVTDLPLRAGYSWMVELLPFIGRDEIYDRLKFDKSWLDADNLPQAFESIPEFLNPLDPSTRWKGYPMAGIALTHFAGMSGVEDRRNVVAATLDRSDPRAGVFGYTAVAKPADITDGLANTILMVGTGSTAGPWIQAGGATIRGARAPYFDPLTGLGSAGMRQPGVFVLLADGSARAISQDIQPEVFKALCTMHGAESVDASPAVTQSP